MFKPLMLIPFYNHGPAFEKMANQLNKLKLPPVLIVDDGSDGIHSKTAQTLCKKYHFFYIRNEINKGKGNAIKTGLYWAEKNNYTHALQIDADGQHDIHDIDEFLKLSQKHPSALISAQPEYDSSAPKSRLYGRKITNFWVWIETRGKLKLDAMCGFRIYPILETIPLLPKIHFDRMGFDIEILVKSFLNKIPALGIKTKIIYPKTGVSHFHVFRDNVKISCLHTYLCIYSFRKLLTKWWAHERSI